MRIKIGENFILTAVVLIAFAAIFLTGCASEPMCQPGHECDAALEFIGCRLDASVDNLQPICGEEQ